jgi:transcriptional regulator with PAS, ATPase and Fis domain
MPSSIRVNTVLVLANVEILTDSAEVTNFRVIYAPTPQRASDVLGSTVVDALVVLLPVTGQGADELVIDFRARAPEAPILVYEPTVTSDGENPLWGLSGCEYISGAVPGSELLERLSLALRGGKRDASLAAREDDDWSRGLVGSSRALRQVIEIIRLVGPRRSTVLITGETGSGKEVAARALHAASNRSGARMVAINCAALPDNLLEAELFGHTKGAFTGAVNARVGLFEQAHRGTIFLDEISEMPLQLQSKLLRVLQEREVPRIGSSEPVPVDVRVIAASNTDLLEAVANRRFREDLYYRLKVVALKMPPLRERADDIQELSEHFLLKLAEQEETERKHISREAMDALLRYAWPGNVRQLEHALESAVALSGSRLLLEPNDLDLPEDALTPDLARMFALDLPESGVNFEELMTGIERRLLERALAKSGGNKARAANMLQMKRTTLISKFKSLEVCA